MLVILCVAGATIGGNGISGQIREEDKELIPDIPNSPVLHSHLNE